MNQSGMRLAVEAAAPRFLKRGLELRLGCPVLQRRRVVVLHLDPAGVLEAVRECNDNAVKIRT